MPDSASRTETAALALSSTKAPTRANTRTVRIAMFRLLSLLFKELFPPPVLLEIELFAFGLLAAALLAGCLTDFFVAITSLYLFVINVSLIVDLMLCLVKRDNYKTVSKTA